MLVWNVFQILLALYLTERPSTKLERRREARAVRQERRVEGWRYHPFRGQ